MKLTITITWNKELQYYEAVAEGHEFIRVMCKTAEEAEAVLREKIEGARHGQRNKCSR